MTDNTTTVLFTTESEENPYHQLLFDGLSTVGIETTSCDFPGLFPLTTQAVLDESVDAIQVDWMYQFYMSSPTNILPLNIFVTAIRTLIFLLDLFIVSTSQTNLVWTVHNKYNHEKKFKKTERIVNEFTFWVADAVTVKCASAVKSLSGEYLIPNEKTFTIIRDGSYNGAYPNEISREQARSELSVDGETFIYLFFGRIRDYKGVDILIETFQQFVDNEAELWIVGNPWDKEIETDLRAQSSGSNNITFKFEFIPNESVQTYLNMADVLVLPYRSILNSGGVHLGLTFGLPIIAPEMGCIPSIVPPENEELLYDGSRAGLSKALNAVREESELDAISRANRKRAEKYDWLTPAQQLANLYQNA